MGRLATGSGFRLSNLSKRFVKGRTAHALLRRISGQHKTSSLFDPLASTHQARPASFAAGSDEGLGIEGICLSASRL